MSAIVVPEMLQEILIAIAMGGLIGLERENEPERKYAGLRTLALLAGVAPAIVGLSETMGSQVFVYIYLSMAVLVSLAIVAIRTYVDADQVGLTTSVAAFVVAVLGLMVGYNLYFEATALLLFTVILLAEKERLHAHVNKLSNQEISDAVKLGLLVFVLLPILPSEPIDPLNAVNLNEVLLLAIFVLLIEFVAFVSMRQVEGSHGLYITGLLGGVANSFATMGVLARISKQDSDLIKAVSSATMVATTSMIVRNVAIATALSFPLIYALWKPAAVMCGVAAVLGYLLREKDPVDDFEVPMDSPFSFRAAAKFAAAFIAIAVASTLAEQFIGSAGLYVTAFVGGLVSSTAVATSAVSLMSNGTVEMEAASGMVLIGIFASITSKIALVEMVNSDLRRYVTTSLLVIGLSGLAVFFLL